MQAIDLTMMRRALALAERGRGHVEPNPLVGAVLVRDGRVVGEGWHEKFGAAHAEVNALKAAGSMAQGATLYVTLEPCCHYGKTPPCTNAIIQAGVRQVVTAMADPFTAVAGKGFEQLRKAGLQVEVGVAEVEAKELNAPYLKLIRTGRPYVIAKWAMTLDGKIATATGDSRWVSGEESRAAVHQLRGRMDAIIVGIGTAIQDDPLLTARPPEPRTPARVVLDSRLQLPVESQLARTAKDAKVLIVHATNAEAEKRQALEETGCECFAAPADANGRVSIAAMLEELGRRQFTNVLVEGGEGVLGGFFDAGEIDEVMIFIAPKLIGGKDAPSPIGGLGRSKMADALFLAKGTMIQTGADWMFRGGLSRGD